MLRICKKNVILYTLIAFVVIFTLHNRFSSNNSDRNKTKIDNNIYDKIYNFQINDDQDQSKLPEPNGELVKHATASIIGKVHIDEQSDIKHRLKRESDEPLKSVPGVHHKLAGMVLKDEYNLDINGDIMFPYLINNNVCYNESWIYYVLLVMNTAHNAKKRHIIRTTWGRHNFFKGFPSRTVFLLGNVDSPRQRKQLKVENRRFRDIIQFDFLEEYQNLTIKVLAGIKWAMRYCHQAKYVFRSDDDLFVDLLTLKTILDEKEKIYNLSRAMIGQRNVNMTIFREDRLCSKWCLANDDYPQFKTYPPYIYGAFYILSVGVLEDIYRTAISIPYHWIEDAFITGFVRLHLKDVSLIDIKPNATLSSGEYLKQFET